MPLFVEVGLMNQVPEGLYDRFLDKYSEVQFNFSGSLHYVY